MSEDEISERIIVLSHDPSDYDSMIENLLIAMVNLDKSKFDTVLSRAILHTGFEETILKIVYPLLDRIGVLWMTGSINPPQEHFISNLIRQKLIVAVDSLIPKKNTHPKHFLLFLPEGELHELGLLFYSYIIQKRGHMVTYLGQSVPLTDMAHASTVLNFEYLLTSIVTVCSIQELKAYLEKLSDAFPGKTIYISGRQAAAAGNVLPPNIIRLDSVNHFLELLS
jgi:methanogenic corrinoid protein MtbC1